MGTDGILTLPFLLYIKRMIFISILGLVHILLDLSAVPENGRADNRESKYEPGTVGVDERVGAGL